MTDMFSSWFSNADSRCGRFELACMECMEYYGFKNGKVICKDYYEDFVECKYKQLEARRNHAMALKRKQRYFEAKAGKRDWIRCLSRSLKPTHTMSPQFTRGTDSIVFVG